MARPTSGYYLDADNTRKKKRVPGVTTIIGRYGDNGGLMHWAWKLGIDGIDYREASKEACSAGHLCHDMIEAHINNEGFALPDDSNPETEALALTGFEAYRQWADVMHVEVIATEEPLVSERLAFGGTLDAAAWTGTPAKRRRTLLDWKTTNATRVEHLIQLAAYDLLWTENHPGEPFEAWQSLRIGKEHADFHFHSFSREQINVATDVFVKLRELYETYKSMNKWL